MRCDFFTSFSLFFFVFFFVSFFFRFFFCFGMLKILGIQCRPSNGTNEIKLHSHSSNIPFCSNVFTYLFVCISVFVCARSVRELRHTERIYN